MDAKNYLYGDTSYYFPSTLRSDEKYVAILAVKIQVFSPLARFHSPLRVSFHFPNQPVNDMVRRVSRCMVARTVTVVMMIHSAGAGNRIIMTLTAVIMKASIGRQIFGKNFSGNVNDDSLD